ncbi:hypothetical protein [Sphingomonas sp. 66-10]|uniref:hypothetical protein n=1 Tax=Sphingomonas sp. 66-10 TaxID=1895848 RepID=UPI000A6E3733|nr:hypothetical protein [Sphingomonas sp. 66-10]
MAERLEDLFLPRVIIGHADTLRDKVSEIGRLQARLAQTKARLEGLIREIEARPDDIDCAANARRVLSHLFDNDTESEVACAG